jgi:hypothetical protein
MTSDTISTSKAKQASLVLTLYALIHAIILSAFITYRTSLDRTYLILLRLFLNNSINDIVFFNI